MEPRVFCEDVTCAVSPEDTSMVAIRITYRVKSTNDRRNLVYPFYVIPREES